MSKLFKESIHSDIIIHWTGRDFDPEVSINPEGSDVRWHEFRDNQIHDIPEIKEELLKDKNRKIFPKYPQDHPSVRLSGDLEEKYLERLKNILCFGLWMTESKSPEKIYANGQQHELPQIPRICFTELKLSESRTHAYKFGRLGIGVKRLFLSDRCGQPMHYVNTIGQSLFFPPYVDKNMLKNPLFTFFKNMSTPHDLTYDFYSESEWRIIYDSRISQTYFINPWGDSKTEFKKYSYRNTDEEGFIDYCERKKGSNLKYLIPLDGWLAMIIYPSPEVKNRAQRDCVIRRFLKGIKGKNRQHVRGPQYEQKMMPIEMDLDVCNHF